MFSFNLPNSNRCLINVIQILRSQEVTAFQPVEFNGSQYYIVPRERNQEVSDILIRFDCSVVEAAW